MADLREQLEAASRRLGDEERQAEEQRRAKWIAEYPEGEKRARAQAAERARLHEMTLLKKQLIGMVIRGFVIPAGYSLLDFLNQHRKGGNHWEIFISEGEKSITLPSFYDHEGDYLISQGGTHKILYSGVVLSRYKGREPVYSYKTGLQKKVGMENVFNLTFLGFRHSDQSTVVLANGDNKEISPTYIDLSSGTTVSLPDELRADTPEALRTLIDRIEDENSELSRQVRTTIDEGLASFAPAHIPDFPRI